MLNIKQAFAQMASPTVAPLAEPYSLVPPTEVRTRFTGLVSHFSKLARTRTKDEEDQSTHSAIGAALGAIAAQMSGAGIVGTALISILGAGLAAELGPRAQKFISEAVEGRVSPETTVATAHEVAGTHPEQLNEAGSRHPALARAAEHNVNIPVVAGEPRQLPGAPAQIAGPTAKAEVAKTNPVDDYKTVLDSALRAGQLKDHQHQMLLAHTGPDDLGEDLAHFQAVSAAQARLAGDPQGGKLQPQFVKAFANEAKKFYEDDGSAKDAPQRQQGQQGQRGGKGGDWTAQKDKFDKKYEALIAAHGTAKADIEALHTAVSGAYLTPKRTGELLSLAEQRAQAAGVMPTVSAEVHKGFVHALAQPKHFNETPEQYSKRQSSMPADPAHIDALSHVLATFKDFSANKNEDTSRAFMDSQRAAFGLGVPFMRLPHVKLEPAHTADDTVEDAELKAIDQRKATEAKTRLVPSDGKLTVGLDDPKVLLAAARLHDEQHMAPHEAAKQALRDELLRYPGPQSAGDFAFLNGKDTISPEHHALPALNAMKAKQEARGKELMPEADEYRERLIMSSGGSDALRKQMAPQLDAAHTKLVEAWAKKQFFDATPELKGMLKPAPTDEDPDAVDTTDAVNAIMAEHASGTPGKHILSLVNNPDQHVADRAHVLWGSPVIHRPVSTTSIRGREAPDAAALRMSEATPGARVTRESIQRVINGFNENVAGVTRKPKELAAGEEGPAESEEPVETLQSAARGAELASVARSARESREALRAGARGEGLGAAIAARAHELYARAQRFVSGSDAPSNIPLAQGNSLKETVDKVHAINKKMAPPSRHAVLDAKHEDNPYLNPEANLAAKAFIDARTQAGKPVYLSKEEKRWADEAGLEVPEPKGSPAPEQPSRVDVPQPVRKAVAGRAAAALKERRSQRAQEEFDESTPETVRPFLRPAAAAARGAKMYAKGIAGEAGASAGAVKELASETLRAGGAAARLADPRPLAQSPQAQAVVKPVAEAAEPWLQHPVVQSVKQMISPTSTYERYVKPTRLGPEEAPPAAPTAVSGAQKFAPRAVRPAVPYASGWDPEEAWGRASQLGAAKQQEHLGPHAVHAGKDWPALSPAVQKHFAESAGKDPELAVGTQSFEPKRRGKNVFKPVAVKPPAAPAPAPAASGAPTTPAATSAASPAATQPPLSVKPPASKPMRQSVADDLADDDEDQPQPQLPKGTPPKPETNAEILQELQHLPPSTAASAEAQRSLSVKKPTPTPNPPKPKVVVPPEVAKKPSVGAEFKESFPVGTGTPREVLKVRAVKSPEKVEQSREELYGATRKFKPPADVAKYLKPGGEKVAAVLPLRNDPFIRSFMRGLFLPAA